MAITNVFQYPQKDYHCLQSGIAWPSGLANLEIIDCTTSLGGHPAKNLSIYSFNGDTTIRLNVIEQVYANHGNHNTWINNAAVFQSPKLIDTFEKEKDNITIPSGMAMHFKDELPINDIKIVAIVNGNRIIFS